VNVTPEPPLAGPPVDLAGQTTPAPPSRRRFEVRVSTIFIAVAALSLPLGFLLARLDDRFPQSGLEVPVSILIFLLFPLSAFVGAVSALVFALWKRRWQFVLELILGIAFLAYISTWEAP